MKKLIPATFAALALSMGINSALASDFTDDVNDLKASITAIQNQLDSMDVSYNTSEIETGLNRTQELRALEAQYGGLKADFSNAYSAN